MEEEGKMEEQMCYRGYWEGGGFVYRLDIYNMNLNPENASAAIKWTLLMAPQSLYYKLYLQSGVEYLEGSYNIDTRTLNCLGVRVDDPHDILGAGSRYTLTFSEDGEKLEGYSDDEDAGETCLKVGRQDIFLKKTTLSQLDGYQGLFDLGDQGTFSVKMPASYLKINCESGEASAVMNFTLICGGSEKSKLYKMMTLRLNGTFDSYLRVLQLNVVGENDPYDILNMDNCKFKLKVSPLFDKLGGTAAGETIFLEQRGDWKSFNPISILKNRMDKDSWEYLMSYQCDAANVYKELSVTRINGEEWLKVYMEKLVNPEKNPYNVEHAWESIWSYLQMFAVAALLELAVPMKTAFSALKSHPRFDEIVSISVHSEAPVRQALGDACTWIPRDEKGYARHWNNVVDNLIEDHIALVTAEDAPNEFKGLPYEFAVERFLFFEAAKRNDDFQNLMKRLIKEQNEDKIAGKIVGTNNEEDHFFPAGLKRLERADYKTLYEYNEHQKPAACQLVDIIRGLASIGDVPSMLYFYHEKILKCPELKVLKIKNRFAIPESETAYSYRDLCMLLEYKDFVCELQLTFPALLSVRKLMHSYYNVVRATTGPWELKLSENE
eukprot:g3851.t1